MYDKCIANNIIDGFTISDGSMGASDMMMGPPDTEEATDATMMPQTDEDDEMMMPPMGEDLQSHLSRLRQ